MIGADNSNRSQTQGVLREGDAERSVQTNRRPYEQERTERPGAGDECASKHEIQQLSETRQVESDGTAGKFSVLPREASERTKETRSEESAEAIVGGGEKSKEPSAQGLKSQGDDLNPNPVIAADKESGARNRSHGKGKQKWLSGLWLPNGGTGQAAAGGSESQSRQREERKEQAPISLIEKVVSDENAEAALLAVERNGGAAGIDGMGAKQLRSHLGEHWSTIRRKLLEGTYVPSPVKRVWIEKSDGGKRPLGVPTVLDRFIQQLILGELQPVFEPIFSPCSWGFRPNRGAHDAVKAAQSFMIEEGKSWVVDMDIKGFFDHVDHDILMRRVSEQIKEKPVLKLIGRYLRSGVREEGRIIKPKGKGTPQGGPLSPLLANIYLDALDKELESRGLSFSRYADDCNIYVRSEKAAQRVLKGVSRFVEQKLKLEISATKSGVDRPWKRKFLGFSISREGRIEVSGKAIERFRARVREQWENRQNKTSNQLRDQWKRYIRGWWEYYRLTEKPEKLKRMDGWIRRHIRKCYWQRWHSSIGRVNALNKLDVSKRLLKTARSSRGAWRMAASPVMHRGLNNQRLKRHGFLCFADLIG